jgi:putative Holliday junction resolvase
MTSSREIPRGHLLSFDFGKRRIGVAVGQAHTGTASALDTVANSQQPDWSAIGRLVDEWKPTLFVVGLPLSKDGGETPMSTESRNFGKKLGSRFGVEVAYFDERLTSRDAERQFAGMRAEGKARRKDARRLDALAAKIILENWLQSLPTDN